MNKITREHYPVENLPLDLRQVVGSARTVTVTLQPDNETPPAKAEIYKSMTAARDRMAGRPPVDGAARIRKLRDEWDA